MLNDMLEILKQGHTLKKIDAGVFKKVTIQGTDFKMEAYDMDGVGRVSTIQAKAFLGLFKMETFIINPCEKDMPIFYFDRVRAKGKDTVILDLFHTQLEESNLEAFAAIKEKYAHLPVLSQREREYDCLKLAESVEIEAKKNQSQELDALVDEYFKVYVDALLASSECKSTEKMKKVTPFMEMIYKEGGLSIVDIFMPNYGEKITRKLCKEVLFGA